jgi:hypothetical protein
MNLSVLTHHQTAITFSDIFLIFLKKPLKKTEEQTSPQASDAQV